MNYQTSQLTLTKLPLTINFFQILTYVAVQGVSSNIYLILHLPGFKIDPNKGKDFINSRVANMRLLILRNQEINRDEELNHTFPRKIDDVDFSGLYESIDILTLVNETHTAIEETCFSSIYKCTNKIYSY